LSSRSTIGIRKRTELMFQVAMVKGMRRGPKRHKTRQNLPVLTKIDALRVGRRNYCQPRAAKTSQADNRVSRRCKRPKGFRSGP